MHPTLIALVVVIIIILVGLEFETRASQLQGKLEPHLQSILPWLFWRWGSHELFAWAGLEP
jgi:hypothetical protein